MADETETTFNFDSWIDKWKLNKIKQCFIDHNIATLHTLNMNNANYAKLSVDHRVLSLLPSNPQIFANITNGMLSLNELRDSMSATIDPHKSIAILPAKENQDLRVIHDYIEQLKHLKYKLQSITLPRLQEKHQLNEKLMKEYRDKNIEKLDEIRKNIDKQFEILSAVSKHNEIKLQNELSMKRKKFESICRVQQQQATNMDKIYLNCVKQIELNKEYIDQNMLQCERITMKYDTISNGGNWKQRESEILCVGQDSTSKYQTLVTRLNNPTQQMNQYVAKPLNLPLIPESFDLNQNIRRRIVQSLKGFVVIKNEREYSRDTNQQKPVLKQSYSRSDKRLSVKDNGLQRRRRGSSKIVNRKKRVSTRS